MCPKYKDMNNSNAAVNTIVKTLGQANKGPFIIRLIIQGKASDFLQ